jgi:hypothetical protein
VRSALPSALTHPVVWFAPPLVRGPIFGGEYWPMVATLEVFAWLAEAACLKRGRTWSACLRWSLAANVASAALGLLSRALVGVP